MRFKRVALSRKRRIEIWILGIWDAICTAPPDHTHIEEFLNAGDDGYKDAPFEVRYDAWPMRFEKLP